MKTRHRLAPFALFTCAFVSGCDTGPAPVPGARPDPTEEAAVLAAVDRFFVAMAARDAAAFAATMLEDGMTCSQALRDGAWQLRRRSNRQHIDGLGTGTQRLVETYWQPTVLQRGPIAVVWAPYRFQIDGKDSHFGVDVFDMVQVDGAWRVANVMWTVEPDAGAELLPPSGTPIRPAALQ